MWLISTTGFFSVVRAKRRGMVQVRARSRRDIDCLRKRFTIKQRVVSTPQADYPYRVVVPTSLWQRIARALAADAEGYANFKSAVHEINPTRAQRYYNVWCELRVITADEDIDPHGVSLQELLTHA